MRDGFATTEEAAGAILRAHSLDIRDVEAGEEPFLYSSGNKGPGYVTIKNLVGRKDIIRPLAWTLAEKIVRNPGIDFVAGNVTGGVIPGWLVSEYVGQMLGEPIPFVYVREARKKGGQKELVTGLAHNPKIQPGDNALIMEELVNFAETTCNSAAILRSAGYKVTHAGCLLFYNNPMSLKALEEHRLTMLYVLTLEELLAAAEKLGTHKPHLIADYREFLKGPAAWMEKRGFKREEKGGTV